MSTNDTLRGLLRDCKADLKDWMDSYEEAMHDPSIALIERIDAAMAEPVSGGAIDERAAFEAYALSKGWEPHMLKRRDDNPEVYDDWGVQPEWRAWQARAALNGGAVAGQADPNVLVEALEHMRDTIEGQVELINIRAPGRYLDKQPILSALLSHRRRCIKALKEFEAPAGDACTCKGGE